MSSDTGPTGAFVDPEAVSVMVGGFELSLEHGGTVIKCRKNSIEWNFTSDPEIGNWGPTAIRGVWKA